MTARQVANCVSREKQEIAGFAGGFAKLPKGVSLVGGQSVFKKIDVVGHSAPASTMLNPCQVADAAMLTAHYARGCKPVPYHNHTLLTRAISTGFATFGQHRRVAPCDNPS